jgi:hypothetical protein
MNANSDSHCGLETELRLISKTALLDKLAARKKPVIKINVWLFKAQYFLKLEKHFTKKTVQVS